MPIEIERKYLLATNDWRRFATAARSIRQAYVARTDKAVVRVRIVDAAAAVLTIKSSAAGLARQEYEYPIPLADGMALLTLCEEHVLEKTRHLAKCDGRLWDIDVYGGVNAGLVLAEIELESAVATVDLPHWIGREVTGDPRYYAARLAERPFRSWSDHAPPGRGE